MKRKYIVKKKQKKKKEEIAGRFEKKKLCSVRETIKQIYRRI